MRAAITRRNFVGTKSAHVLAAAGVFEGSIKRELCHMRFMNVLTMDSLEKGLWSALGQRIPIRKLRKYPGCQENITNCASEVQDNFPFH